MKKVFFLGAIFFLGGCITHDSPLLPLHYTFELDKKMEQKIGSFPPYGALFETPHGSLFFLQQNM